MINRVAGLEIGGTEKLLGGSWVEWGKKYPHMGHDYSYCALLITPLISIRPLT